MRLARQQRDRLARRALIDEAFVWLDRYFDADGSELVRRIQVDARW